MSASALGSAGDVANYLPHQTLAPTGFPRGNPSRRSDRHTSGAFPARALVWAFRCGGRWASVMASPEGWSKCQPGIFSSP